MSEEVFYASSSQIDVTVIGRVRLLTDSFQQRPNLYQCRKAKCSVFSTFQGTVALSFRVLSPPIHFRKFYMVFWFAHRRAIMLGFKLERRTVLNLTFHLNYLNYPPFYSLIVDKSEIQILSLISKNLFQRLFSEELENEIYIESYNHVSQ